MLSVIAVRKCLGMEHKIPTTMILLQCHSYIFKDLVHPPPSETKEINAALVQAKHICVRICTAQHETPMISNVPCNRVLFTLEI